MSPEPPERGIASWASIAVGLGVPAVGILVVLPLVADTDVSVAGVPLLFLVLFALMPVTTAALWVAWRIDAPRYPERKEGPR